MQHAFAIIRGFGKPNHNGVNGVPRFDFEATRRITANHDSFGALITNPFVELTLDITVSFESDSFNRMDVCTTGERAVDLFPSVSVS